jgi:hypothetical protein
MDLRFFLIIYKTSFSNDIVTPCPIEMQIKILHHREWAITSGTGTNPLMPRKARIIQFLQRHKFAPGARSDGYEPSPFRMKPCRHGLITQREKPAVLRQPNTMFFPSGAVNWSLNPASKHPPDFVLFH